VRAAEEGEPPPSHDAPAIGDTATLLEALSLMVEARCAVLAVRSAGGATVGSITLRAVVERHP
jgi:CBS domain-containing protein